MFCLVAYLSFSAYKLHENSHNKLEEFFRGLKSGRKSKIYTTFLLSRRFIFIKLLLILTSISSKILICILVFIQLFYLGYIALIRPYCNSKENLVEIINETYIFFLLSVLIFLNSEKDWNSVKTSIYMWLIVSNTLIVFIIVLVSTIINLIKLIRNKCCNNQGNRETPSQIAPKTTTNPTISNQRSERSKYTMSQNRSILSSNKLEEENKHYTSEFQQEEFNPKARQKYIREVEEDYIPKMRKLYLRSP